MSLFNSERVNFGVRPIYKTILGFSYCAGNWMGEGYFGGKIEKGGE